MIKTNSRYTSKEGSKAEKIENTIIRWPLGVHSIMPLDLIQLQKSWAGCKAWFTVDSDHEKASFPATFHTDKKAAASPLYVRIKAVNLHVGQRHPGSKQTLTMNKYIRLLYNECPFIQTLWKRAGQHTVVRTGYSPDIRGSASINVFFLKTPTQWTVNWAFSWEPISYWCEMRWK